jgi:pimeloyl-ACP methyl ester carboxylesterase
MRCRKLTLVVLLLGGAVPSACTRVDSRDEPPQDQPPELGDTISAAISFETPDGGRAFGTLVGHGEHAVILGSNGCLAKEGWAPEARTLAAAGFRTLAIDFRGSGQSRAGAAALADSFSLDLLGAVRYLRASGARRVSIVGASCAGDAAAQAAVDAAPGEIDDLVLLAFGGIPWPERLRIRKLFVVTRDDANDAGLRLPTIQAQFDRSPEPKELMVLPGSAHAQSIFRTDQGDALMRAIIQFLSRRG